MFANQMVKEKFIANVNTALEKMGGTYFTPEGVPLPNKGQAVSFLLREMRDYEYRWKNLGSLHDFECLLEECGFKIVNGKNSRGNRARVVTTR